MIIKKIAVAGSGTLGAQISWYIALKGFPVTLFDISNIGLEIGKSLHHKFVSIFQKDPNISQETLNSTLSRIHYSESVESALSDSDLLIESIPEKMDAKISFYKEISSLTSPNTIIASNSDTFLPSSLAPHYKYPEQLIATHFAYTLWENPLVEIMGHSDTDVLVIEAMIDFVKQLDVLPIVLQKENSGFIMNSLLIPMCSSALSMLEQDVATLEDIDKSWMVIGNKYGPFAIMDAVGLDTVYNIEKHWGEKHNDLQRLKNAQFIKSKYIKEGKIGIKSGRGFYKYPKPNYLKDSFITI